MKLPGKKAIIASILTLVVVPSAAFATISLIKPKAEVKTAEPVQQVAVVDKQEAVAEPVAEEAPAETAPVETTPVAESVAAPVVLSIHEYANKWLDMTQRDAYLCIDRIASQWPDRFTPEVRERNIKGLRTWANVCSTGAGNYNLERREAAGYYGLQGTLIYAYGANGEFFDTPGAMSHWND